MAEICNFVVSQVTSSSFISGIACGVSLAWLLLKRRVKNVTSLPGNSDEFGEPVGDGDDNFKLVLIVRSDLKMGKGKAAAQCSHAAVMAYERALRLQPNVLREWQECGQAKVVLKVETEQELLELAKAARAQGLITSLVCDAGRTQIAAGSRTVLGIGPGSVSVVDQVSGHLKLY